MRRRTLAFIAMQCLTLVSSCTLYRKPEVPADKTPTHFKVRVPSIAASTMNNAWWQNFHDKRLNDLVETALKNNYSYQIALKNIAIANTYVTQAQSSLFPQLNLNFNTSRNKSPSAFFSGGGASTPLNPSSSSFGHIFNLQQLYGSFSYQVDVWNQLGNAVNVAQANQSISEADSNVIKLTLITSIVDTYYQIVAANENLVNLNKQKNSAAKIAKLTQAPVNSGLVDASALDNAKIQFESIKANMDNLKKQQQSLIYMLAYLAGEFPEEFNIIPDKEMTAIATNNLVPTGIPSQMVANRPDIQAAYYQIVSYGYLEKQNIANFLPSFSLTGNYGYSSTALSNLLSYANSYWNYGLYSAQFLFDYKTRMSIYKRSDLQYESAILSYRDTVRNAFREVDSALITYKEDNEALTSSLSQLRNNKNKLDLSASQYQSGLVDYSAYLTTNLSYLQSRYNSTNQKLVVIQDIIQVYNSLALGL